MANLVSIYKRNDMKRMLDFLQKEVERACCCFVYKPMTEQNLQRMEHESRQAAIRAQMRYGYRPYDMRDVMVTINDGTRSAYERSWVNLNEPSRNL